MSQQLIQAVTVNHNTSLFAELMLRSLKKHHRELSIELTVVDDNSSDGDDFQSLERFAAASGIPLVPSGYEIAPNDPNSHGMSLQSFVLTHSDCSHYLFVDPDVCFQEDGVIDRLLAQLEADSEAFGIMPRCTWDGRSDHTPQCVEPSTEEVRVSYKLVPCQA